MVEKVRCFRYWRIGHYKWEYSNIEVKRKRRKEKEVVCMARPQKVQQEERPVCSIQEKAQEYYDKWSIPPEGILLLKRRWITKETVKTYVDCRGCKGKGVQTHKNQEQGFLLEKQVKNIWYSSYQEAWNQREGEARKGEMMRVQCIECRRKDTIMRKVLEWKRRRILCLEYRVGRKREWWNWKEAACPIDGKVQQSSAWTEVLKGTAREGGGQRDLRRTFKMLREVQLNIGVEKMDMHEGVTVKALLDSGATEMFMDRKMAAKYRFKLQKLEKPVVIRNVDGTNNSAEAITYQVKANMYYKNHIERMQMDVCNLREMDVILGMPWLQTHNLEINQETREVKMTRLSQTLFGL